MDTGISLPQKWRLLGAITAILVSAALLILAADPGLDGIRRVIRVTARTSVCLFLLVFVATVLWKRFPNRATSWTRQNRRYLGLGFAVSHGIHALAIIAYARLYPDQFAAHVGNANLIPNYVAYLFILLLALTSFDRAAAMIGPRAWKILHTAGIYYLWASFAVGFGKRIPVSGVYVLPLIMAICALAFRLWPVRQSNSAPAELGT